MRRSRSASRLISRCRVITRVAITGCLHSTPGRRTRVATSISWRAPRVFPSRKSIDLGGSQMKIDPKLHRALTGISGILVTPFDAHDRLAPGRLMPISDRAINAGVHILVANGNTGEFYGLTTSEAETMVHFIAEQIGKGGAALRRG